MWNWKKKKDTNEFIYKAEIETQIYKSNLGLPRGNGGKDELRDWDWQVHATIYKTDN